jgi:hypothetical protein
MRRVPIVAAALVLAAATAAPTMAAKPAPRPTNDEPSTAIDVGLDESVDFTTTRATTASSDPTDCEGSGPVAGPFTETIWYRHTATADGLVVADAGTFDYLAVIFAFEQTATGLIQIDCSAFPANVTVGVTDGTTYLFMVGSLPETPGGGTGQFTLAEGLQVSLTVDAIGRVDKNGVATISGTVACSSTTDFLDVNVVLDQSSGRFNVHGEAFASADCVAGEDVPWSVQVVGVNGRYSSGSAIVDAFADGCALSCAGDSVAATVRLRK